MPRRRDWSLARALALGSILALAAGCARNVPSEPSSAALYRDLQRVVSYPSASGWQVDRIEVRRLLPKALMSACRVEPGRRQLLLRWIDHEIERRGGPVEEAYARRGKSLDRVRTLLELTRIRMLLAAADEAAPSDCPFWLEPEHPFRGRQILDDRWLVSAGGGGKGIVVSRGGAVDVRAGGSGRLLLGRVFGSRWALLGGAEVGGNAAFPKNKDGQRSGLVLGADVSVPLVYRYFLVNTFVEGEAGPFFRLTEKNLNPEPGVHVGLSFGGDTLRRRWVLPGAAFGVSYERTFPRSGDALNMIKAGLRVNLDLGL